VTGTVGTVLFHEEQQIWSGLVWVLLVTLDVPFLLIAVLTEEWVLIPAVVIVSSLALLIAVARLVVDVTSEAVSVSFHFLWPRQRIPIADVRRAHATRYNALADDGGYGVRLGPKGWAFNTGGDEGVLVETGDGKRVMIGSRRPQELAAAIERARDARA
jgi:hypothetical protein